jgi:hypothetical protein
MRYLLLILITLAPALESIASVQVPLSEVLPQLLSADFKRYDSPFYSLYTDVSSDEASEAILRMEKMAAEYQARLQKLFVIKTRQRLPLVLFSKAGDYRRFGFDPDSAGVFTGEALFLVVKRDASNGISERTWRVMQHEGFHQFAATVIHYGLPPWLNEGLASYFEEAIFTGDGMVSGVIPLRRAQQVAQSLNSGRFVSIPKMMTMSHESWNAKLEGANYDQAWAMVHFLANAEDGKYRVPFLRFLQSLARGSSKEKAWTETFGSTKGFEAKWREFWLTLPLNSSLDQEVRAAVAGLSSFLGRGYGCGMVFSDFQNFIESDAKSLKTDPTDWLPPALYTRMQALAVSLQRRNCTFSLEHGEGGLPQLVCTLPGGRKVVGRFTLNHTRMVSVSTKLIE